jgi:hypothetical protein
VDFVSFFKQLFGQVRAVLSSDTGNECRWHKYRSLGAWG